MFEEARAVELDERLGTLVRGRHTPVELARAMTDTAMRASAGPRAGGSSAGCARRLRHRCRCDSVRLAGTRPRDALDAVVFAAGAADVPNVIVGGREIVRDGAHVKIDVASELAAAIAAVS